MRKHQRELDPYDDPWWRGVTLLDGFALGVEQQDAAEALRAASFNLACQGQYGTHAGVHGGPVGPYQRAAAAFYADPVNQTGANRRNP